MLLALTTLLVAIGASEDNLSRSLAVLANADRGTVDVTIREVELGAAIDQLRSALRVPIQADWDALAMISIRRDDHVTIDMHGVPPLAVMRSLALTIGSSIDRPVIDATNGQIFLTSHEGLEVIRETAIYDVADIASDATLLDAYRAILDQAAEEDPKDGEAKDEPEEDATSGHGTPPTAPAKNADVPSSPPASATTTSAGDIDSAAGRAAQVERLARLLMEHIDPEGWANYGGTRGRIDAEGGRLVVSATPATHRALRSVLAAIREEAPTAMRLEAKLVAVPAGLYREIETASGSDRSRIAAALGEAATGGKGVQVVWSPAIAARLDETALVESERDGAATKLSITPRHDRAHQSLALAVHLERKESAAKSMLETIVDLPGRRGVAILRLPDGPSPDTLWLLVLDAGLESRTPGEAPPHAP